MPLVPDLLVYHKGCPDGIAGAWIFWSTVLNRDTTKLYPGEHNGKVVPLELCKDKVVFFVDFSYPKDDISKICDTAKYVVILDHHKTALPLKTLDLPNLTLVLDMDRSGCQIAWDYVHPTEEDVKEEDTKRPWFIDDIADRDLWKWVVPDSKATTKALFSSGFYESVQKFDEVTTQDRNDLVKLGKVLNDIDDRTIKSICSRAVECLCYPPMVDAVFNTKVVEADHSYASDVGNVLANSLMSSGDTVDFAAVYRYSLEKDEWWLSLRVGDNVDTDLTEVVKMFDKGGGHPKAAGITLFGNKEQTLSSVFEVIEK